MTDEAKRLVEHLRKGEISQAMAFDASCLIVYLDAALEHTKRKMDAAVEDINMLCMCDVCTRSCKYDKPNPYCKCADFEWRGLQEK